LKKGFDFIGISAGFFWQDFLLSKFYNKEIILKGREGKELSNRQDG